MKISRYPNVKLISIRAGLPSKTNQFSSFGIAEHEIPRFAEISKKVGVSRTRVEAHEGELISIAIRLIEETINGQSITLRDIDILICVTQTNIYTIPGLSSLLQEHLFFSDHIRFIDINQGCSGYVDALQLAAKLVSQDAPRILIVTLESMSSVLDPLDFGNRILFGDACTVTLIEYDEEAKPFYGFMRYEGASFRAAHLKTNH